MKYESIKSIILLLLVIASGVLTWSLWTYKPNVQFPEKKYVHDINIAKRLDFVDVIKPVKILFHIDDTHYGTYKDEDIEAIFSKFSSWNFYDISQGRLYSDYKMKQLTQSDGRIEIQYPDLVPFDVYKGIIHLEMDHVSGKFDCIVIHPTQDKDGASVYFINSLENIVYEAHVNPERVTSLFDQVKQSKDDYEPYIPFQLTDENTIFIPEKAPKILATQHFIEYISPERWKTALFRDPNKVRRDYLASGEQYADDTSLMSIDNGKSVILYENFGQEQAIETEIDKDSLVKKSIHYINEHSGWNDDYRYMRTGEYQKKTVFQLYANSLPVFNEQGMTEMRIYWGKDEIYKYERPYFSLEVQWPDPREVILPTAEEALNFLLKVEESFKPELLEELIVGYKLKKDINVDNQKDGVSLEPSWYYLYGGAWIPVDSKEIREGKKDGLGPN